jgi:hypothetical protein
MRHLCPGKLSIAAALGFLALACPRPSQGQTIPSPYRFIEHRHDTGVFVGALHSNRGDLGIGPGGGMMVGARYGIDLSGPLGAELSSFLVPTDRTVYAPQDGVGLIRLGEADLTLVAVEARLRFTLTGDRTWRGFAPFVAAGGGVAGSFRGVSPLDDALLPEDRVDFGPTALLEGGVGTRFVPGDRVTLRLDATYNFWRHSTPVGWGSLAEELGSRLGDEWLGVASFALGLSYRF